MRDMPSELVFPSLPERVLDVLRTLADAGQEAAIVGGVVRDRLLGLEHTGEWDIATAARPEEVVALFDGAVWENRFGTVTIEADPRVEITAYRAEGAYRDRRRPDEVRFGVSLTEDLARRDFTINAMAWLPLDLDAGRGTLVDPHGGRDDLASRVLRAVGDPRERFAEDALRLIRAARFAGRLDLAIEPATEGAIRELAPTTASVSAERVRDELMRILANDPVPSRAIGILERLGILPVILPELAALRGVPQAKAVAGDALDHSLQAVDAAAQSDPPVLRLAALLHDLGKARTLRGGHFLGHERVSAELATDVLRRLRLPRSQAERVIGVIRHHMYDYDSTWTDAAVRRFVRRLDDVDRDLLFALRRADNAASGVGSAGDANQEELEGRIAAEVDAEPGLLVERRLAIDGHDLQRELGMAPGPEIGAVLDRLTGIVLDDPTQNRRDILLAHARRR
jgi:tRNA nucleotidyltransferase (CCA-adding enzyme)